MIYVTKHVTVTQLIPKKFNCQLLVKIFDIFLTFHLQLGHELLTQRRFGHVTKLSPYTIKAISCGANHCLASDEWGKVFSWGSNSHGQLGHNQGLDQLSIPK